MVDNDSVLAPVEKWTPQVFIAAGVLLLIGGANDSIVHFLGVASTKALSVVFLMGGFLVALLGLVGLYPQLADRSQRLAQVSLGSIVLTGVGISILAILAVVGLILPSFDVLDSRAVAIVALPTGLLLVASFLLFGVTVLRTNAFPRTIGILLLIEFVLVLLATVGGSAVEALVGRGMFLVGAKLLHFLVLCSIGYSLHSNPPLTKPPEPTSDVRVR